LLGSSFVLNDGSHSRATGEEQAMLGTTAMYAASNGSVDNSWKLASVLPHEAGV
jgi:hypothetical protein